MAAAPGDGPAANPPRKTSQTPPRSQQGVGGDKTDRVIPLTPAQRVQRPALRKLLATAPAASNVAAASLAVMATVVSISLRLPPAAAARMAEAAAFSLGNSPITSQSCRPKVKYQPNSLPPTLLKSVLTASSRFSGLASMPLTASVVNFPRDI